MELGQKAALYPEMWIYIIHFSKSFKFFNSPTWICLSADLWKDSPISQYTHKRCCVMGECCVGFSEQCLHVKFMHLRFS